ncbi:carbohydrate ABC transporter permease [Rhizobium phaseoli]|nr:carbohydrate ABC transporter permease [Rhizobium phaseoli]
MINRVVADEMKRSYSLHLSTSRTLTLRPGLATTFLFAMLMSWDEFPYALLLTATDPSKTVTVAIGDFLSGRVANYGMIAAAGVLAGELPPMVGFYVQRHIVEGMTAGGVKG